MQNDPLPQRPWLLLAALCLLPLAARAAPNWEPDNPPQGLFDETWQEIYLNDVKAGYGHMTLTREGDVIRTETELALRIARGDRQVKTNMRQIARETIAGDPLTLQEKIDVGGIPMVTNAVFGEDTLRLNQRQGFLTKTDTFQIDGPIRLAWGIYRSYLQQGFRPGTTYTLKTYVPDLRRDAGVAMTVRVVGKERISGPGGTTLANRIDTVMDLGSTEQVSSSWVTEAGAIIQTEMQLGGISLRLVSASEAEALADFKPAEMFVSTLIPVNGSLPVNARTATWRIRHQDGRAFDVTIPEHPAQAVERLSPDSFQIRVGPGAGPASEPLDKPAKYLRDNLYLNLPPDAIATVFDGAESEESLRALPARARAERLERQVSRFVADKNLSVVFATARDVLRERSGDCTEHAVLLAALGRRVGLPSRTASGLVYVDQFANRDRVLGFHMWTQFHVEGRWVDYDAAVYERERRPRRIALSISDLNNESLATIGLDITAFIGQIEMALVDAD